MYPGTIFNWHDQSGIQQKEVQTIDNSPLFLVVSSFDRGPEELNIVSTKFYDLYGSKMNFDKHGQPALQAANMIDNGARLLVKRLVADDATLANLIAVATVDNNIVALKAQNPDDPNAQTIDEILGRPAEVKEYAERLQIHSVAGTSDNTTVLTVEPAIEPGNSYYWIATTDITMPELDTEIVTADYTFWDGTSEISLENGTNIKLLEVNEDNQIKKCSVIAVTSKIPHPANTSVDPITDLPAVSATSEEGTDEGNTVITIEDTIATGNAYYYTTTIDPTDVNQMITANQAISEEIIANDWTSFGTQLVQEISVENNAILVFVEFRPGDGDGNFYAVEGFSITACSKLPPDTNSSDTPADLPEIPTVEKYIVTNDSNCTITWHAECAWSDKDKKIGCLTLDAVKEAAESMFVVNDPIVNKTETGVNISASADFPLICMADNGRGLSNKSFKIYGDNVVSKDMNSMYYTVNIFDGTERLEKITVALNPSTTYNDNLYGINDSTSVQVQMFNVDGAFDAYIETLSAITHISTDTLNKYNLIKCTNQRGEAIPGITISDESVDFGAAYGVNLDAGNNGAFGDAPFGTEAYIAKAIEVFEGDYDDAIWDVDYYKIAAVFDANYPVEIKKAIGRFVTFREDCVFFRDFGLNVNTWGEIKAYYDDTDIIPSDLKNRYIADYCTTYQIINPETKKRDKVTMLYDLSAAAVSHFINGCYKPLAGSVNNMILKSAIEGTINFTPRVTPKANQKELIDNIRVNYAIFESGICVVQSTYSSQTEYTQLSFINNVLGIQEVMRAIRTQCPKSRFTFTTDSDFTIYSQAVSRVLVNYTNHFAELYFEYTKDPLQEIQKIFYAELYFRFNNWEQTESFDIFALGNE